jgi:hypothetical protein
VLLEGQVTDEQGQPLAGAAVVAEGAAELRFAVTDRAGRFSFPALGPGRYLVRAHLSGFVPSRKEHVELAADRPVSHRVALAIVAEAPLPSRPLLAASMLGAAAQPEPDAEAPAGESDHGDSPTDWRIRHLTRSVLREANHADLGTASAPGADASHVLSFLSEPDLSTQVHLLTISAFDSPEELFSGTRVPVGVAYVTLSAPVGEDASWTVQGAITEGDVSAWVLGGSYATTIAGRHSTDVGLSYSAQRYDGSNPVALAAMGETSRTVGALHASDRWTLARGTALTLGGRYARYGYTNSQNLFSPFAAWEWTVFDDQVLRASVAQTVTAPGAEEFVPSPVAGLWMPPQRTFSPLVESEGFRLERTRHMEIAVDRPVGTVVVTARAFRQVVSDQIVTIFGLQKADITRADLGHFFTATAGNVEALGWGVSVSRPMSSRVRGSVAYSQAHATWLTPPQAGLYAVLARSAARAAQERISDVTTTVETDIPETATRVFAIYKLNSGYARGGSLEARPGLSGRFDVQVSQRLPFTPQGQIEWEALVAVSNLFREIVDGASLYDELLVVRPPKRIVGGLTVRF